MLPCPLCANRAPGSHCRCDIFDFSPWVNQNHASPSPSSSGLGHSKLRHRRHKTHRAHQPHHRPPFPLRIDYIALGDWHGLKQVGPGWYAGLSRDATLPRSAGITLRSCWCERWPCALHCGFPLPRRLRLAPSPPSLNMTTISASGAVVRDADGSAAMRDLLLLELDAPQPGDGNPCRICWSPGAGCCGLQTALIAPALPPIQPSCLQLTSRL